MLKLSDAQQLVNQFLPNFTGGAANIINALGGNLGGNKDNAYGSPSLFDIELSQTNISDRAKPVSHPDASSRQDASPTRKYERTYNEPPAERPEDEITEPPLEGKARPVDPGYYKSDKGDVKAPLPSKIEAKEVHVVDHELSEELDDADLVLGTAEEMVAQLQQLLEQLTAFADKNPVLAKELAPIFAPIKDALQLALQQLSGFDPETLVTQANIAIDANDLFKKLDRLAGLFNQLQNIPNKEMAAELLENVPEDVAKAAKALLQASNQAVIKVNDIAETLRQLVPTSQPVHSELADKSLSETSNAIASQFGSSLQAGKPTATTEQVAATRVDTPQLQKNDGNQQQNLGGQQQQQNQAQQQALVAANQGSGQQHASAKLDPTLPNASSVSTSNSLSQPSQGFGQTTSATFHKQAANFEQALKQAGKPPVAEQVQVQIKSMIRNGESKMIVKLDPPELGELEIRMQINKAGRTEVFITVERPQTLEMLQKDARMLAQALQDAGLQADSSGLSFNLQNGNDSPSEGQKKPKNIYPAKEDHFDTEMLSAINENYVVELDHGVNIHA